MRDFRRYEVWQRAEDLAYRTYVLTAGFPRHERFGLVSQMRRSAVSVTSNIAEGAGRRSDADFARFLDIAMGSLSELHCQTALANRLHLIESDELVDIEELVEALRRKLHRLHSTLTHR